MPPAVDPWARYQKRRKTLLIALAAWLWCFVIAGLSAHRAPAWVTTSLVALFFCAFVFLAVALYWHSWFLCPRCHNRYFASWGWWGFSNRTLVRRCVHCGLAKYATPVWAQPGGDAQSVAGV